MGVSTEVEEVADDAEGVGANGAAIDFPHRAKPCERARHEGLVSAVDIAPTILGLAELEPLETNQGVDFAPLASGYGQRCARSGGAR